MCDCILLACAIPNWHILHLSVIAALLHPTTKVEPLSSMIPHDLQILKDSLPFLKCSSGHWFLSMDMPSCRPQVDETRCRCRTADIGCRLPQQSLGVYSYGICLCINFCTQWKQSAMYASLCCQLSKFLARFLRCFQRSWP